MAPRRAHTKSRNGCDQCKKRRVKCDELGPPCGNCQQREMECVYSGPALLRRGSLSAPTTTATATATTTANTTASPSVPSATTPRTVTVSPAASTAHLAAHPPRPPPARRDDPSAASRRLRDLELMHHWCTTSCFSLAPPLADQLRYFAPKEALRHPYLMDAMLALAAFHLANELNDPVAAAPYLAVGLQYQSDSVRPFRDALQNIGPANCDAVFVCSILMMISALVAPLLSSGLGADHHSIIDSMLLLVDFGLGVGSIIEMSESWLVRGPFANIWIVDPEPESPKDEEPEPAIRRLYNLNDLFNGKPGDPLYEIYRMIINRIEKCSVDTPELCLKWLIMSVGETAPRLRTRDPFALMLLLHWGVLLDKLDQVWWAKYSGKRLVEDLSISLLERGGEWSEGATWARAQVGL